MSSKRQKLAAALGAAKRRGKTDSKKKPDGAKQTRSNRTKQTPSGAAETDFVGAITTNGERQDLNDRRIYYRKGEDGNETRVMRKMSVYISAEVADRLDIARVRMKARNRSELVERALLEFLEAHAGA